MAKVTDWRKTKRYAELKASMLDDLAARGSQGKPYTDKVDEYLDFWCRRQELQADVARTRPDRDRRARPAQREPERLS
ncbi:MAG: hypothetical protein ACLSHJ_06735 [Oscillospiraceae bacterium]